MYRNYQREQVLFAFHYEPIIRDEITNLPPLVCLPAPKLDSERITAGSCKGKAAASVDVPSGMPDNLPLEVIHGDGWL